MKKLVYLFFLAISISCSSDDDNNENSELNGEWFLINISCFCGFDETINFNDFTLRFDNSENILHLDNPTESYFYIAESGSYEYNLQENIISIEGTGDSYRYYFEDSNLILTLIDDPTIADDELSLMYQRKGN